MGNAAGRISIWICAALMVVLLPSLASAKIDKDLREQATAEVTEGLKSEDPLVKSYAILAAGELGDRKLDKELEPFLASTNRQVRQAAIVALLVRKNRKAQEAFGQELEKAGTGVFYTMAELLPRLPEKLRVAQLKDLVTPPKRGKAGNDKLRDAALRYLSERENGAVYELLGLITKSEGDWRAAFHKALLANPRPEALGWAKQLMADKKDAKARLMGLELAIAIGGKEVDGLVRGALKDSDAAVSTKALAYLEAAGDESARAHLVSLLADTPASELEALVDRVLASGARIPLGTAQKLLGEDKGDNQELNLKLHALLGATQEKDAFEQLVTLERSTLIEERRRGVYGLGYTNNPAAVGILGRTLNDGNRDLRLFSARGLGLLNKPQAVTILQKSLPRTSDQEQVYLMLEALSVTDDPNAAKVLMFKVSDPDPKVKRLALDGLRRSGDKQVLSVLEVLANDNDAQVRWDASLLILKLDPDTGMARLERALQRPPEGFMDQVMELPTELRDKVLVYMLKHKEERHRLAAMDALTLMGAEGLALRRQSAGEAFPEDVRKAAVETLLGMTSAADMNFFKRMAQVGGEDDKMRAMQWLHRQSSASMAGFFRTMMNGAKDQPALKMAALYGLLRSES